MEDKPSPLKKGISRPCHIAIKKVEVSLEMIQKIGNEEVIPSADRKNLGKGHRNCMRNHLQARKLR
jgi:hypothetical protein